MTSPIDKLPAQAAQELAQMLDALTVAAHTAVYCYFNRQGAFAQALDELANTADAARAALNQAQEQK